MIIDIKPSPLKTKRYRATIKMHDNSIRQIDFGLKGGVTYIDKLPNGTPLRTSHERRNYLARHLGNKTENKLISNLIPSPSLLSAYLLWGPTKNFETNVKELNKLLKK